MAWVFPRVVLRPHGTRESWGLGGEERVPGQALALAPHSGPQLGTLGLLNLRLGAQIYWEGGSNKERR